MNVRLIVIVIIVIIIAIVICASLYIILRTKQTNYMIANIIDPMAFIKYSNFIKKYLIVSKDVPIYGFFHFCPKSPDNKLHNNIINEQISTLINSGLYNKSKKIYYGCNCHNCDHNLEYLNNYTKFEKLSSAICPNKPTFENDTINSMIKFAKNSNELFYGYYIHTKGTTAKSYSQHAWRRFMMYWMMARNDLCIDILNRGFNTVGVNYTHEHYSGNFWWFSSNYLKKLDYIQNINDRMMAEKILFSKYEKNKHICLTKNRYYSFDLPFLSKYFDTRLGLYYFPINVNDTNDLEDVDIGII